jgi:hypothetical protein
MMPLSDENRINSASSAYLRLRETTLGKLAAYREYVSPNGEI